MLAAMAAYTAAMSDIQTLRTVLAQCPTIAVVGLSPQWHRPSFFAAKYMQSHGYRIVPVNPVVAREGGEILGERCFSSVTEAAANLLANHGTQYSAQSAADTSLGITGHGEAAAAQAKGKKEELQRLHGHLDHRIRRSMASVTPLTGDLRRRFLAACQLAALLPSRLPPLAACRRMATNLLVGVLLPIPALSSGTSGLASGK